MLRDRHDEPAARTQRPPHRCEHLPVLGDVLEDVERAGDIELVFERQRAGVGEHERGAWHPLARVAQAGLRQVAARDADPGTALAIAAST